MSLFTYGGCTTKRYSHMVLSYMLEDVKLRRWSRGWVQIAFPYFYIYLPHLAPGLKTTQPFRQSFRKQLQRLHSWGIPGFEIITMLTIRQNITKHSIPGRANTTLRNRLRGLELWREVFAAERTQHAPGIVLSFGEKDVARPHIPSVCEHVHPRGFRLTEEQARAEAIRKLAVTQILLMLK